MPVRERGEYYAEESLSPGISRAVSEAADLLRKGGVVAFPTETVYGLGANAFDPAAVARLFEIKRRPLFDPLIVHVSAMRQLEDVAVRLPAAAYRLADACWPGPLSLVVSRSGRVPDLVTSGLPTVAVRMPRHPLALALIRRAGIPLAAPSANPFGRTSPTTAEHVIEELGGVVDRVLDGGPCSVGIESTVLSLAGEQPVLLRPGAISVEEIEELIGPVHRDVADEKYPASPGRLPVHYATRTPLVLASRHARKPCGSGRVGLLAFREPTCKEVYEAVEVLSKAGSLREAAANLFAAMRRLDALDLDLIVAEPVPGHGLGRAINDRLRRAAGANADP